MFWNTVSEPSVCHCLVRCIWAVRTCSREQLSISSGHSRGWQEPGARDHLLRPNPSWPTYARQRSKASKDSPNGAPYWGANTQNMCLGAFKHGTCSSKVASVFQPLPCFFCGSVNNVLPVTSWSIHVRVLSCFTMVNEPSYPSALFSQRGLSVSYLGLQEELFIMHKYV